MIGRNTLVLNKATMLEAMQLFIEHIFDESAVAIPKVTDVGLGEPSGSFELTLEEADDGAEVDG